MLKNLFSLNQKSLFSMHDPVGVKLLTRLPLHFSHPNEHKCRHNFKDFVSPMCGCGSCVTNILQTRDKSSVMMFSRLDASIKHLNEGSSIDVLLYGSDRFNDNKNTQILLHTICFIQATKGFERPLIEQF